MEKYIIVVLNKLERKLTLFLSVLEMPLISVWTIAIIIFAFLRKVLRSVLNSEYKHFGTIFLYTFGLSFGTAGNSNYTTHTSSSERLLLSFLSIFAMLAGILYSGMLFNEFSTSLLVPSINSLEDLGKNPHIEIWMPLEFDNSTETLLQHK